MPKGKDGNRGGGDDEDEVSRRRFERELLKELHEAALKNSKKVQTLISHIYVHLENVPDITIEHELELVMPQVVRMTDMELKEAFDHFSLLTLGNLRSYLFQSLVLLICTKRHLYVGADMIPDDAIDTLEESIPGVSSEFVSGEAPLFYPEDLNEIKNKIRLLGSPIKYPRDEDTRINIRSHVNGLTEMSDDGLGEILVTKPIKSGEDNLEFLAAVYIAYRRGILGEGRDMSEFKHVYDLVNMIVLAAPELDRELDLPKEIKGKVLPFKSKDKKDD